MARLDEARDVSGARNIRDFVADCKNAKGDVGGSMPSVRIAKPFLAGYGGLLDTGGAA